MMDSRIAGFPCAVPRERSGREGGSPPTSYLGTHSRGTAPSDYALHPAVERNGFEHFFDHESLTQNQGYFFPLELRTKTLPNSLFS